MLLIPLIIEQLFTALMGTADTMMVAVWAMRRYPAFRWWIPSTIWC